MTEAIRADGVRFGRTIVLPFCGDPLDEGVEALVLAANRRGSMGAGGAGPLGFGAGSGSEREAMTRAPLDLGTAIATGAGTLAPRGVRLLIHAVVHPALGEPVHLPVVRRAAAAALAAADTHRIRSLAFLPISGGATDVPPTTAEAASILIDEIVAHLRRSSSRLERILLVARLDIDLPHLTRELQNGKTRRWLGRS